MSSNLEAAVPFLLEAQHLSKSFGPAEVLSDISVALASGEVHAIVGENGAGKSTLMKILAGHLMPTRGTILFDGTRVVFTGPVDAERRGIVLVHQEILLAPHLTVAQNISMGREIWHGIRDLRANGTAVLYISHRLTEVAAIADRITVLRDGKH